MNRSSLWENIEFPFYDVFEQLRKNGFSLGIAEYQLLLDALQLGCGFSEQGLDYKESLKLCKTLWLKPNQSAYVFENIFQEHFKSIDLPTSEDTSTENSQQNADAKNIDNAQKSEGESGKSNNLKEEKRQTHQQRIKFELGEAIGSQLDLKDKKQAISRRFLFNDYYFEVSKRQMQQICRFLPLTQASAIGNEIDIEKTIQHFAENAIMVQPVFKKQVKIHNRVHILIDHEGSMHAFETLSETFSQALQEAFEKQANSFQKYYFYNVPQKHIFKNTSHTEYKRTAQWIAELKPNQDAVIIISDAGAARDSNSGERLKTTLRFLIQLKKHTNKIVWLNPLPKERWLGNSAKRIADVVSMFYLDNAQELQNAVNILKGK